MRFTSFLGVAVLLTTMLSSALADTMAVRSDHPRLFFTAAKVTELKARVAAEKNTAEAWAAVLARANAALEKPEGNPGAMEALALAYRMTGDNRFAERVRDFLMRETQRANWGDAELLRRDPVWHSGLGTAHSCSQAAIAFDSIHDFLSPEERRNFAHAIVELGILPILNDWLLGENRIHALDTMGHNWWSACVFQAGVAALAVLDEEPRARSWLDQINAASCEWFGYTGSVLENKPANFDPAGAFYESVNYASFAMGEYLTFRLAWSNALRSPAPASIALLEQTGNFFLNAVYATSSRPMSLNFGDGSVNADGSRPVALLWANGFRRPDFLWYLQTTRQLNYREGLDRSTPLGLLYFPTEQDLSSAPAVPSLPPSKAYTGIGWAMLRDSWKKDATLLGVKAGYTWNHSHADEGSFILFHRGANLLIDSGNANYARPEYDEYYRQSRAHNVVLFNGAAENPENTYFGSKFPGSISHLIDTGGFKYVMADATGPTSKTFNRNYRHFLWIGDVILVIDDVESYVPGQFEWLLHYEGKAQRKALDLSISQGAASVLVRPLFPETFPDAGLPTDYPEKMRLVEKSGFRDHDPDTKQNYFAFSPTEQTRRTKFITAITLVTDANQTQLPRIERWTDKDVLAVRVQQGATTTEVFLNLRADGSVRHRNANTRLGGWDTDAYLLARTFATGADAAKPETCARIFVADGSYLRTAESVALDSLSKVFFVAENNGDRLAFELQGQPLVNVAWHASTAPAAVSLNHAPTAVRYDTASHQLRLSLGAN